MTTNSNFREFLAKRKQQKQTTAEPVAPVAPQPNVELPKQKKPKAPPKAKEAPGECVVHSCGHKTGLHYLKGSLCPTCVAKRKKDTRLAKEITRRAKKEGEAINNRLPDGSIFNVTYDATTVMWSGTLTIHTQLADGTTATIFSAQASGVRRLLDLLDKMYRQSLTETQKHDQEKG